MKTIKELRELAGLSKAAAARLLSESLGRTVPYQTISRFESGESANPTMKMIQALADAYGVTESQIIDAFRPPIRDATKCEHGLSKPSVI